MLITEKVKESEIDSCLSRKQLLAYTKQHLSEKEKKKIEYHLLDCERCIAAFQFVLNAQDESEASHTYADLSHGHSNINIRKKISKKISLTIVAVACLLIFGFAYSRLSKHGERDKFDLTKSSEFLKRDLKEPGPNEISTGKKIPETAVVQNLGKTIVPPPEAELQSIAPASINNDFKLQDIPVNNQDQIAEGNPKLKNTLTEDAITKQVTESENAKPKKKIRPVPVYWNGYKVSLTLQGTDESQMTDVKYKKELEFIFRRINKSDYPEAIFEISKFLELYPQDINGIFYRGYIYYLMLENKNALSDFEHILKKRNKIFHEDAQWHIALILNRETRTRESQKILFQLISGKSVYSDRAKQLLELMAGK